MCGYIANGEVMSSQLVVFHMYWVYPICITGTMLFTGASTIILQEFEENFQLFISIEKESSNKESL